ncbi:hypothetical protein DM02DRAFT_670876 [Periconia macrospinosa]|uniref:Uncharacterized protein n=1 Tax=Periconia macrospinosa TaxID=97972 RepID=A0A2V1DV68_9PLEO|nr:hypothetical protein DM02DRAFT_670876 [Periconia macrospinosa]
MTAAKLESLPSIALDFICEYLDSTNPHQRHIFNFSLVSRSCFAVAHRHRCRQVCIRMNSAETIKEDLEMWKRVLGKDGKRHVRHVKLTTGLAPRGRPIRETLEFRKVPTRDYIFTGDRHPAFEKMNLEAKMHAKDDVFLEPPYIWSKSGRLLRSIVFNWMNGYYTAPDEKKAVQQELPGFLSSLPGLKILVWSCLGQIPSCIMDILNTGNIQLRNYNLVLPSVCTQSKFYQTTKDLDECRVALYENTTHLSTIFRQFSDNLSRNNEFGFEPEALIQVLSASSKLTDFTDFEELRSFSIQVEPEEGLQKMLGMASKGAFTSLKSLDIVLVDWYEGFEGVENGLKSLNLLLTKIAALGSFRLRIRSGSTARPPILSFQVLPSLTRFSMTKLLVGQFKPNHQDIIKLAQSLPNLRHLELCMHRSHGDSHETDCYRALGSFTRLENLDVHLVFDNTVEETKNMVYFNNRAEMLEAIENIRLRLINYAIDDFLACQIFRVISRSQAATKSSGIPSLGSLRLIPSIHRRPDGEDAESDIDVLHDKFTLFFRLLARTLVCTSHQIDTKGAQGVHVKELFSRTEENGLRNCISKMEDGIGVRFLNVAWLELWPEATGDMWFKNWHSFPLEECE